MFTNVDGVGHNILPLIREQENTIYKYWDRFFSSSDSDSYIHVKGKENDFFQLSDIFISH